MLSMLSIETVFLQQKVILNRLKIVYVNDRKYLYLFAGNTIMEHYFASVCGENVYSAVLILL
jgi:hypothetical protein